MYALYSHLTASPRLSDPAVQEGESRNWGQETDVHCAFVQQQLGQETDVQMQELQLIGGGP